jgi:tRNA dimethylallyltransferase
VRPIIVGGTGLYFAALTGGLAAIPPVPPQIRAEAEAAGPARLLADLAQADPATLARIDRQNPMRVQRAWEVWRATGRGLAAWQEDTPPPLLPLASCTALRIEAPRDWLASRIDARLAAMVAGGALDEVRALLPRWQALGSSPALRAIGAAELRAHLLGRLTRDEALAAAQLATRQYAKRQRTWFRSRMRDWTPVSPA